MPNLERAASWNEWTDDEKLLQFAGHLRGRALLEWNLLDREKKTTYMLGTEALQVRLDPGGRALAAQDFRHTFQRETEQVGDFIRRLERTFQLAYGRDNARDTCHAPTQPTSGGTVLFHLTDTNSVWSTDICGTRSGSKKRREEAS